MAEGIKKVSENVIINKRALVVTDPSVADNIAISTGALWSNPSKKGLKIKTGQGSLSLFDAEQLILASSITSGLIKDGAITESKIANGAVTEPKIADLAVSARTIANGAVIETKIANSAVTNSKIKENNVLTKHIADKAIVSSKIRAKAVLTEHLADKAVSSDKINDYSIISRTIDIQAIQSQHYGNESIPHSAYSKGSVYGEAIAHLGVHATHLEDNAVVSRSIANGAVTGAKVAEKAIQHNHLANRCVEGINVAQESIGTSHIATEAISTEKISKKAVTKVKLGEDVIELIGNPVKYDGDNNVHLKNQLNVAGNATIQGTLTAKKVFNAVFMDLAEAYEPAEDEIFNPGDIVQVNEDGKLTRAKASSHFPIVGIVSDEYAECFGATEEELQSAAKIPVGLIGKIHVNVIGPVKLGDKIALIRDGIGASCSTNNLLKDNIVGKALESNDEAGLKKVLCLVYPN